MKTKINKKMLKSGYKKEHIAKYVGVSIFTITSWCKGHTYPTIKQAQKLKEILGLDSIDELIDNNIKVK